MSSAAAFAARPAGLHALASDKSRPALIEIKNAEAFAARATGVSKIDVPSGFFGGASPQPSHDLTTIAVDHRLVAALAVRNSTVDHLTKWFFPMRQRARGTRAICEFHSSRYHR